jgi:hypothetical protein
VPLCSVQLHRVAFAPVSHHALPLRAACSRVVTAASWQRWTCRADCCCKTPQSRGHVPRVKVLQRRLHAAAEGELRRGVRNRSIWLLLVLLCWRWRASALVLCWCYCAGAGGPRVWQLLQARQPAAATMRCCQVLLLRVWPCCEEGPIIVQ